MSTSATAPLDLTNKFVRANIHDKIVGSIYGSALGDAIGLYTEFLPKKTCQTTYPEAKFSLVKPITPILQDSHRNRFPPRHWTDDTDQALLLILPFIHNSGRVPDADEFARRLQVWVQQGLRALDTLPLGLGATVGAAVLDGKFLSDPVGVARRRWVIRSRVNAPNGSLMRTHPVGVFCVNDSLEESFRRATEISETTHADPRCTVACCISVGLIRGLLRGEVMDDGDVDGIIWTAADWVDQRIERMKMEADEDDERKRDRKLDRDELRRHVDATSLQALELDEWNKIGYVYKCLGSGVVLLRRALRMLEDKPDVQSQMKLFENLITELIMEGGDADTNAACAGALLGALLGFMRLPRHWSDGLLHREWLIAKAEATSQLLGFLPGEFQAKEHGDAAPDGGRGMLDKDKLDGRWQKFVVDIVQKDQERKKEAEAKRKQASSSKGLFGMWK